jgi:multiple sugar transport system permease protein
MRLSTSKMWKWVVTNSLILLAVLIFLYPLLWLMQFSLKSHVEAFSTPIKWIFKPNFSSYIDLFTQGRFLERMFNSFFIATISTILALSVGTPAAYALSRMRSKLKRVILVGAMSSRMVPPIAFLVPYFIIFVNVGLIDTRFGMIIAYTAFNIGLVTWSMWTFFDGVPKELDEQARIDGATVFQTLVKIILPLGVAGLASTAVLCFVMAWNDFIFALILTRSRAVTAPVEISRSMAYQALNLGRVAAGAVLVGTPAIIFSVIVRKYLRSGLTAGAVKG